MNKNIHRQKTRFPRTHKTVVLQEKGGVGKSTVAAMIAHEFTRRGLRVLTIDMDKQRDLTGMLLPAHLKESEQIYTVADLLLQNTDPASLIINVDEGRESPRFNGLLSILPAHQHLHTCERKLLRRLTCQALLQCLDENGQYDEQLLEQTEFSLELGLYLNFREQINSLNGLFDLIIFDTPGNPGLLANLALAASDWALPVVRPSGFDMKGIRELASTLSYMQAQINPHLRVAGCVLNAIKKNSKNTIFWKREIKKAFGEDHQFTAVIPHSVRFEECATEELTLHELEKTDANALIEEFESLVQKMIDSGERQIREQAKLNLEKYYAEQQAVANA